VVLDGVCLEVMMGNGVGGEVLMRWCHKRQSAQDKQLSKRERDDTCCWSLKLSQKFTPFFADVT
jgi:hypothetical protein